MRNNQQLIIFTLTRIALILLLMLFSISLGSSDIPFKSILYVLSNHLFAQEYAVTPVVERIIMDLRLPRALLAILVGAGLAIVGILLQTATRNDLADPFLFGLSSGSATGAVLVITKLGDILGIWTLPLASFLGGLLSALTVIILFRLKPTSGSERLIISGLAISFLFGAMTNYLVFSGDQRAASSILFWSLGGLGNARWNNLWIVLSGLILLLITSLLSHRKLDALLAGDETAESLGVKTRQLRIMIFLVCALSTATFVSLTGVIGFIGLMVPHIARAIVGIRHYIVIPFSAICGALVLLIGDLISRTLVAPQELPIGMVTAAIGGIFVLLLVLREKPY